MLFSKTVCLKWFTDRKSDSHTKRRSISMGKKSPIRTSQRGRINQERRQSNRPTGK